MHTIFEPKETSHSGSNFLQDSHRCLVSPINKASDVKATSLVEIYTQLHTFTDEPIMNLYNNGITQFATTV